MKQPLDVQRQKFQAGLDMHRQGKLSNAAKLYEEIIFYDRKHFGALHLLGVICAQTQQFERAVDLISKAIKIDPKNAEAYYNRGTAFKELKRYEDALVNYDKAISLKRDYTEAYYNRGIALLELSRFKDALASNDKAISLKPEFAEAYYNRGIALLKLSRFEDAIVSYDKGIALKPGYAEAYNNRGTALKGLKRFDEALASHDKAIELKPDLAEAYSNRGNTLKELKRLDEALPSYNKAMEMNPEIKFLAGYRLFAKMSLCDWTNFVSERKTLQHQIEAGKNAAAPFVSMALFDSPELQRRFAEAYAGSVGFISGNSGPIPKRSSNGKVRIGYFSADFREHPVSYLTAEMFELHDRERFETVAFSFYKQEVDDEMRQRLKNAFDSFIDVSDKSDEEIASLSRGLKIDIAVDLAGYTENSRPRIFALRAAPIQVSYIGYLGTLGSAAMDYLVSDRVTIPKGSEADYSEKIVWLPSYQVNDSKRPIGEKVFSRKELGILEKDFVFCCFNNSYKISPEVFSSWMKILESVPNSVLLLLSGGKTMEENLRIEAQVRGTDPKRLVFAGKLPREQYIARFRCADLFLDTLPYNAGTTASDALWAGLPVLTCLGKTFASRVCASVLASIGLSDLITRSSEEYEALAIELAAQPQKLMEISNKLKANRLSAPLFDSGRFTKNMESAYFAMFERYNNNLQPDHILVEDKDSAVLIGDAARFSE